MAKPFGNMGPRAAGAPETSIRPMPRPAELGGVDMQPQAAASGGGFMGMGPMTPERYDMAMRLLQASMTSAAGSQSPALAFLAPIIGAVTGSKLADKRTAALGDSNQQMTESLLGGELSPQARNALDVLSNPNAPDYLKDIARTMLKGGMVPVGGSAPQASRKSGGGGRSAGSPGRLVGEQWVDGVLHGRDRSGKWHPYTTADGKLVSRTQPEPAPAAPGAAAAPPPVQLPGIGLPAEPVAPSGPRMPGRSADDDLINKYLGL